MPRKSKSKDMTPPVTNDKRIWQGPGNKIINGRIVHPGESY